MAERTTPEILRDVAENHIREAARRALRDPSGAAVPIKSLWEWATLMEYAAASIEAGKQ